MSANISPVILQERSAKKVVIEPLTRKIKVRIGAPDINSNQADTDRLMVGIKEMVGGPVHCPLGLMNKIHLIYTQGHDQISATIYHMGGSWTLVDVEGGDTTGMHLGLAVDIGTTTVVVYLVDMSDGKIVDMAADYNGQVALGEDILTRIYFAAQDQGLQVLKAAVCDTINSLINKLCSRNDCPAKSISAMAIGANTTMVHLLLGLDPSSICMAPYAPVVNNPGILEAKDIGIALNPYVPVYILPSVGSYVGGDVLAGILACEMYRDEELSLFVDIGTNGEIVLGNRDWLVACAGAAGPALEGGVAKSGMRAEPGAIWKVSIAQADGRVHYKTIGDMTPAGLCGSGLVDCLAELFLTGRIDRAGKFRNGETSFLVVSAGESATGSDILVTQTDINNFMRTKGAVNAAVELLLESVGCGMDEIQKFYAAGAFGHYLDIESAVTLGLYPDLPRNKMIRLGNSSGEGARQVLLSAEKRRDLERIAGNITYFELNTNVQFMNKFISSKFIPHTNMDFYPSVVKKLQERNMLKNNPHGRRGLYKDLF